ncbi:MAG TPA: DMT family transporter [Burkholderiaceae bacterium]|nr:DMT family transporter [Burkholderiaceae bacterium]
MPSAPSRAVAPSSNSSQQLALAAGLFVVAGWGANFSVQKALFDVLPPAAFLCARYVMMPLCAALLLLHANGWRWLRLPRRDALQLMWLGILAHTLHVSMVTFGIHWSTAFSSALIMACGPVFTLLILHWGGHERLTRGQVAGVALACAGVLVFLSDKLLARRWAASGGDVMMLFSASLFSYYTVMSKPLIQRHGGVAVMAYATVAGSPLLVVLGLPTAWSAPWGQMGAWHWFLLLWAALVSAFLGWLVWGWVNERRGVARTAPLQYLMPLVAGLVAWLATGERFTAVKIGGALVTLAGVALAQFSTRDAGDPVREAPAQVD